MALACATALSLAFSCAHKSATELSREAESSSRSIELPTEPLTGQPQFDRARTLLSHGRLAGAQAILAEELQMAPRGSRLDDRMEFLLGVLALRKDAAAEALDHFDSISPDYTDLLDYRLWYKAQALRRMGDLRAARVLLTDLLLDVPDSIWRDEALFAVFEIDLARFGATEPVAELASDLMLSGWLDSDAFARRPATYLLTLAHTLEEAAHRRTALDLYEQLYSEYPAEPEADEAGRALARLRQQMGLQPFEPTPRQALSRIAKLSQSAEHDAAWKEVRVLLARLRPGRAGRTRSDYIAALFWKARLYEQRGDPRRAKRLYRGAIANGFDEDGGFQFRLARLEARKSNKRAIKQHLLLVKHHSHSRYAPESLYLAARLAQLSDRSALANHLFERLFDEYPRSQWAPLAYFNQGWIAFRQGRYAQAVAAFDQIARRYADSDEYLRALYWKGRSQDAAGHRLDAEASYQELLSNNSASYYSALAATRLAGTDPTENLRHLPPVSPSAERSLLDDFLGDERSERWIQERVAAFAGDAAPAVQRAGELIALGLLPEAEDELERAARANEGRPGAIESLLALFKRGGAGRAAQRWAYRINGGRPTTVNPVTRPFWRTIYPLGFSPYVLEYARRYELDPHLVLSIIREESHFDPGITSRADARGLMQIIPPTGEQIARAQRFDGFNPSLLYDPEVNIRFGCYYLSNLLERFSGNPIFAIASYNGGPHNVEKWRKKNGNLQLDVFVEEIPFHETRRYVKKVYRSWALYRTLYGDRMTAILPTTDSELSFSSPNREEPPEPRP